MTLRRLAWWSLALILAAWFTCAPQLARAQDGSGSSGGKVFVPFVSSGGVDQGIWSDTLVPAGVNTAQRWVVPDKSRPVSADMARLDALLDATRLVPGASTVLALPMPDGNMQRFKISYTPIMEAALARQYPEIATYSGVGLDDPTATVVLDRTPAGFHAMVLAAGDTVFIDPYLRHDPTLYASYYRSEYGNPYHKVANEQGPIQGPGGALRAGIGTGGLTAARSGPALRTYRLALAADGEYTQFQGGTVAGALAAMNTTMNRVNGIYRRDLSIQMTLVANTDQVIYTDPNTDPYTDSDGSAMLDQNQANLDAVIGSANYDIGHVFSTGGGGIAGLGVVCQTPAKAQGVTGSSAPVGDPFDIDYVAHEMGHQFNADHTFNSNTAGSCAGNRNSATAFEPGSASTIMGYAGICGVQNLQANSDDDFHAGSIAEITAYVTAGAGNSCPTVTDTGNVAPTVNAGPSHTIPKQTPFTLTGSGADVNNDGLIYTWQEMDLGNAWAIDGVMPNTDADGSARPIFRSFPAVASPVRTFPRLASILDGTNSNIGESLPNISRTMLFRLTAKDGRGGVMDADTSVTVAAAAGPFAVTAPNAAGTWQGGSTQTVQWDVANTTAAPVSCANVDILLSTDGGLTFPVTLVAGTPNDGSENIMAPDSPTAAARIKVACAGNIFFDISNANFTIASATADLSLAMTDTPDPVRAGTQLTYQLTVTNAGPSLAESVTVDDNLPPGLTLVDATSSQGSCSGTTPVNCALGTLSSGAVATIALVVAVDSAAPASVDNTAFASSVTEDPNIADNSATASTIVTPYTVQMTITGGNPQTTPAGSAFVTPLSLQLSGDHGEVVGPGNVITFTPPASGPGLTSTEPFTAVTDAGGLAAMPVTANLVLGSYTVTATTFGATTPVVFDLTNDRMLVTVSLTSTANPSVIGQSVTFTALVSPSPAGAPIPTGIVTFTTGSGDFPVLLNANGVAVYVTSTLEIGAQNISATYSGDSNFTGADNTLQQVVNKVDTATVLAITPNPSVLGDNVVYTATVTAVAPGIGLPTGQVAVSDTTGVFSLTGTLVNGTVVLQTSSLPAGSYQVVASYTGDSNFNPSTSAPHAQVVQRLPAAVNDAAGTLQGAPVTIPVLANDLDPAGGGLTVANITTPPAHGTATIASGGQTVIYRPAADFAGEDTFVYVATDINGHTDNALVTIIVSPSSNTSQPPQIAPVDSAITNTVPFTSSGLNLNVQLPPDFFPGSVGEQDILFLGFTRIYTPAANTKSPPGNLKFGNLEFDLTLYLNNVPHHEQFAVPITLTIAYNPALLGNLKEDSLALYAWDGAAWTTSGISIVARDPVHHTLTLSLTHLSEFALFGALPSDVNQKLYLPSVMRP